MRLLTLAGIDVCRAIAFQPPANAPFVLGAAFPDAKAGDLLVAGITKAVKGVLWPVWRETHHLTSNLRISFIDADNARGVCDCDCMGATRDDVVQMISATYTDHFQRRNGEWRIARRDVKIHYFNPIPGAQMTPPASA